MVFYLTGRLAASLVVPATHVDAVFGSEVVIEFQLPPSSLKTLVCVRVSDSESLDVLLNDACVAVVPPPSGIQSVKLSGVAQGRFRVDLYNGNDSNNSESESENAMVTLEVQKRQEVVPTYSWQKLRAWHTIPNGVETRLPLDGSSSKEVRIPSPWRIQLLNPAPCRHFFRMDLFPYTTFGEVANRIAENCHISPDCVSLSISGGKREPLHESFTVESSNLFNVQHAVEIVIKPGCSISVGP